MPDPRRTKIDSTRVKQLLDAGKTPRVMDLEQYQAFFDGNAYDGLPDFFSADDVPLQNRKPCIISTALKEAVESNVAFAMGEGRFPAVLSLSSESDNVFDQRLGLSADDSKTFDAFNARLVDLGRLEQTFRSACKIANAGKSVAIVLSFRKGLPSADLVWPKLCSPTFGDPVDPYRVTRLEIRYRYVDRFRDTLVTNGEWWPVVMEYLRVIDDTSDTVYAPVEIWDEKDPGVSLNGATTTVVKHGFGLCPVHWYAHNRSSLTAGMVDGVSIAECMLPLIRQYDLALSQRHRAAIYAGDPQLVATGVDDDAAIGRTGRGPKPPPEAALETNRQWSSALYGNRGTGDKLRKGAGEFWRTENPDAKFALLTLPGDGLTALDNNVRDLQSKIAAGLGVTQIEPADLGGAGDLSGRTLSFVFSRQINRVSQLREDFGRNCILPVMNLIYRMLLARPQGVYLPGLEKVAPILAKFSVQVLDVASNKTVTAWISPLLKLKWGDYFEPSDMDEQTRAMTAINAYNAGIVTLASAVEHIRSVFAIQNVDQYVTTLNAEKQQRQADALKTMQAQSAIQQSQQPPNKQPPPSAAKPSPKASS